MPDLHDVAKQIEHDEAPTVKLTVVLPHELYLWLREIQAARILMDRKPATFSAAITEALTDARDFRTHFRPSVRASTGDDHASTT